MKKLQKLLLILSSFMPFWGFAQGMVLDGYKDLKFGMTYQQIASSKLCNAWEYYQQLNSYKCKRFLFNGNPREANAYFNGQTFDRIAIDILNYSRERKPSQHEIQEVRDLLNGLTLKYGKPTKLVCGANYERADEACDINSTNVNFAESWMIEYLNGQIRLVNAANQWVILVYYNLKTIIDSL